MGEKKPEGNLSLEGELPCEVVIPLIKMLIPVSQGGRRRAGVLGGQRRWLLKEWRGGASSLVSGLEAFRDGSRSSSNFLRKEMRLNIIGHG